MINKLDKNEIYSLLNTDCQIIVLDTIDSTNLYLRNLAMNIPTHNTVVIANTQTNGRGRLGRSFFSPADTGIYMSLLLKADLMQIPLSHITIAAGVAVCRTLEKCCSSQPLIKWVNDIFLNKKKVCGILAENFVSKADGQTYIIVGIGINVSTSHESFPDDISDIAGSISPQIIKRNAIIAKLIDELENTFSSEDIDSLICQYKAYSILLNKDISFVLNGNAFNGIVTDINREGNLVVILPDGNEQILKSGEVTLGSKNFTN